MIIDNHKIKQFTPTQSGIEHVFAEGYLHRHPNKKGLIRSSGVELNATKIRHINPKSKETATIRTDIRKGFCPVCQMKNGEMFRKHNTKDENTSSVADTH